MEKEIKNTKTQSKLITFIRLFLLSVLSMTVAAFLGGLLARIAYEVFTFSFSTLW